MEPIEKTDAPETEEKPADSLSSTVGKNITALRQRAGLTQLELGERLSYSDKAISKWERGASIPDAYVLLELCRLFSVSVDYLLTPHDEKEPVPLPSAESRRLKNRILAASVSSVGVLCLSTLLFILAPPPVVPWHWFLFSLPIILTLLLVFNSIWGRKLYNFHVISGLMVSLVVAVYFGLLQYSQWQIFLLLVPAELIVALCFFLKK